MATRCRVCGRFIPEGQVSCRGTDCYFTWLLLPPRLTMPEVRAMLAAQQKADADERAAINAREAACDAGFLAGDREE
jgi:hypothetical protein